MIRVLVADGDPMVRHHLRTILTSQGEAEVVAEAEDGAVRERPATLSERDVLACLGEGLTGHDGAVFGMGAQSLSSPDGNRQISFGMNLMKYQKIGDDGRLEPSEIDTAMANHLLLALCGKGGATAKSGQKPVVPLPGSRMTVKR